VLEGGLRSKLVYLLTLILLIKLYNLQRSLGEREDKMASLAAKIKANTEARKAPQRTAKLAFEHSMAKPPRSVRKQQV
jgi:hypothetical protein